MFVAASIRRALFTLGLGTVGGLALSVSSTAQAGTAMNIHNQTGHEVVVFLFTDGQTHTSGDGGIQAGHLVNGESVVADVPTCDFEVLLVDHEDIWHAEYHDCDSTDLTFTSDTGHGHR
jgi:hypothetical protein